MILKALWKHLEPGVSLRPLSLPTSRLLYLCWEKYWEVLGTPGAALI